MIHLGKHDICVFEHIPWRQNAYGGYVLRGDYDHEKFLVLSTLGLFLAAHGAVAFMTVYPQPALADCTSGSC
jgi:hypothetical protein